MYYIDGVMDGCGSSIKLKDNVETLEVNKDDVLKLRPVSFKWKDSGKEDVGLIAEEVAEIVPDLVKFRDGHPEGMKYDKVALYLLEVVKSQQSDISELQTSLKQ